MAKNMKICYVPYSADFKHPSDRRRLLYWAKSRNVSLCHDPEKKVDVVYCNVNTPLTLIRQAKKSGKKVFFELVDGYYQPDQLFNDFLRNKLKSSKEKNFDKWRRFSELVIEKCKVADKVICPNIEMARDLQVYNHSIHIILDFHEEFPFKRALDSFSLSTNLVWEGQTYTLSGVKYVQNELLQLKREIPDLNLTLLTDTESPLIKGKYLKMNTTNRVRKLNRGYGAQLKLEPWSKENVVALEHKNPLAILPLDRSRYLVNKKPENRLLIMWRIGVPAITSSIPSYVRVMSQANLSQDSCETPASFTERIKLFLQNPDLAKENLQRGQQYIMDFHSKHQLLAQWDELFSN